MRDYHHPSAGTGSHPTPSYPNSSPEQLGTGHQGRGGEEQSPVTSFGKGLPHQQLRPPSPSEREATHAHPEDNVEAKQEVFPAAANLRVLELLMLAGHGERPPAALGTRAGNRPSPLRAAQAWSRPGPSPAAAASWPEPHSSLAAPPAVAPPLALGLPRPECGALIRPRPPTALRPRPQCQSTPRPRTARSSWSSAHAPQSQPGSVLTETGS